MLKVSLIDRTAWFTRLSHQVVSGRFPLIWLNCEQNSCDIYRSNPTAANLIPPAKQLGLTNGKTLLCVLKYKQMTTGLYKKSALQPPCLNPRTDGRGNAQCSIQGTSICTASL